MTGTAESLVREEIDATIDRAGFETLDLEALDVTVTDAFRRKLGDCVVRFRESKSEFPAECEIRIARWLFDEEHGEQWRDTVRHEVAHAHVYTTVGRDVDPHGDEWKKAARRAGADPTARYEGDDIIDAEYVLTCPNDCFERGYVKRSKRIKQPWKYICDECDEKLISYDHGEQPSKPEPGICYVESIQWRRAVDLNDQETPGATVRYLLACPNGCASWTYQRRTKRIKNPWRYTCPDCGSELLSCDADDRPTDLEAGCCHVKSIPWQEPRFVHACPNDCFSVGYAEHCEETRQPERYSCESCGAQTVAYSAEDR